ncbi:MAG: DsrE family protein [Saprospiraceae bacterium]|nr:DsrE family protein [Saprospiraceae bacterium]
MYKYILIIAMLFGVFHSYGQANGAISNKKHKIIFQLVSQDTSDHSTLIRQLTNLKKLAPKSQIEVVCHGPGINLLRKDKTSLVDKIEGLIQNGVDFVACEFTMTQKNIKREQLIDHVRTVPGGILEIVEKEEKDWSYIKAGK